MKYPFKSIFNVCCAQHRSVGNIPENKPDPQTELEKDDAEFVAEEIIGDDTGSQNTEGDDKMDLT